MSGDTPPSQKPEEEPSVWFQQRERQEAVRDDTEGRGQSNASSEVRELEGDCTGYF